MPVLNTPPEVTAYHAYMIANQPQGYGSQAIPAPIYNEPVAPVAYGSPAILGHANMMHGRPVFPNGLPPTAAQGRYSKNRGFIPPPPPS